MYVWRGNTIFIIYTDNKIITGPNQADINKAIDSNASLFEITRKDNVSDFLGVNIERLDDNKLTLSQPKRRIQTITQ
jgi:hypothetical protein